MPGENPFLNSLPENIRNDPSLADFKDVSSLATSYVQTKALVGSSLRIPGADAPPEHRKEFVQKLMEKVPEVVYVPEDPVKRAEVEDALFNKLGRPKDPEGYKLPSGLDPSVPVDEAQARAAASKLGLTQAMFEKLVKDIIVPDQFTSLKQQREETEALKKEWGLAFDEKALMARTAAVKFGLPEAVAMKLSPDQLRVWERVGSAVAATPEAKRQMGGKPGTMTPDEAKAQMDEIRANPDYFHANANPGRHAMLVKRMEDLAKYAWPDEQ